MAGGIFCRPTNVAICQVISFQLKFVYHVTAGVKFIGAEMEMPSTDKIKKTDTNSLLRLSTASSITRGGSSQGALGARALPLCLSICS